MDLFSNFACYVMLAVVKNIMVYDTSWLTRALVRNCNISFHLYSWWQCLEFINVIVIINLCQLNAELVAVQNSLISWVFEILLLNDRCVWLFAVVTC